MVLIILFSIGTAIGSFLNVLIDRLPREESIFKGRSYCESCRKKLAWYDLIPILSFVQLKGKCRYCRVSLSFYYPVVEFTTGMLFVLTVLFLSRESSMYQVVSIKGIISIAYYLFIISSLIVVFFTDIKYGIIPDKIVYPAILISLLFFAFTSEEPWLSFSIQPVTFEVGSRVLAGAGAFLFFLFLFIVTRGRGMGFGDVKLAFFLGLFLGFPKIVIALYVAFLTGAVVSLILVLCGKKKLKGSTIPFGPFLVFGTVVALFWGDILLREASLLLNFLSLWQY